MNEHLVDATKAEIKKLFHEIQNKILEYFPHVRIEHVGGTSIPGALTKGELDIAVMVSQTEFENVKNLCNTLFVPIHTEKLWNKKMSVFQDKTHSIKVDVMVVIEHSSYDTFTKTRDFLKNNKEALGEYNEIKLSYDKLDNTEYLRMKKQFFDSLY